MKKTRERKPLRRSVNLFETVPSEATLDHICRGWVGRDPETREYFLSGGHSQSGMKMIEDRGIPYYVEKRCGNGVRVGVVTRNTRTGFHTWFPEDWGDSRISAAVTAVMEDEEHVLTYTDPRTAEITGWYDGVKIRVIACDSMLKTAYPCYPQE